MIARQVVMMIRQAGISKSDLLIFLLQTVFMPFGEPDPRLNLLEGKHQSYFRSNQPLGIDAALT